MRTPDTYTSADERRRLWLQEHATGDTKTPAAQMIDRLGKAMLDMSANDVEATFGPLVREAYDRGYLAGGNPCIYPQGGLRYRANVSGLTNRQRERRQRQRIDEIREAAA